MLFCVRFRNFKQLSVFLGLFLLVTFLLYSQIGWKDDAIPDGYLVVTYGCAIEKLDPWDSTLKEYFHQLPPLECRRNAVDVLVSQNEDGSLSVDQVAKFHLLGAESSSSFRCTKREVYRNKWEETDRDFYRLSEEVVEFIDDTPMDIEFAEIKCYVENTTLYKNYFFYPVRKPEVETKCILNSKGHLDNHPKCAQNPQLSVLVLGIDSVSRSNLMRMLPDTWEYVVNNMSAIDMLGYNKLGLDQFSCLVPYMTGSSENELIDGCWGQNSTNQFDNCTFLWDIFAGAGYRTALVDHYDLLDMFLKHGTDFHRQVAHYYSHTQFVPAPKAKLIQNWCWKGEPEGRAVLDWALMFQKQFANDLHFGHFWTQLFSQGSENDAQHLDPIFLEAFQKMNEDNSLNNTLLVFISDHGTQFGSFRETSIGRQEENLPFMYFIFPPWFREQFPEAIKQLKNNARRLVTTFDVHETLKSVVNCDYASDANEVPENNRGVSLFRPISGFRTCADAGIPEAHCACKRNVVDLNPTDKQAVKFAVLIVEHLNARTRNVRNLCAKLYLSSVLYAKNIEIEEAVVSTHIVGVLVNPGWATYEATIEQFTRNSSYAIKGDVRRINQYGNSSHCVTDDPVLKTICYCTS